MNFFASSSSCLVAKKKKGGARGLMGRKRNAERLGDLAFKMADDNSHNICRSQNAFILEERPVHVAFLDQKLPCPHVFCRGKGSFFKIDGIDHHYRTVHRKAVTDNELKVRKILHGEETLRCLRKFTNIRSEQVIIL